MSILKTIKTLELIKYIEKVTTKASEQSQILAGSYGNDFNTFFYRQGIANILCPEILHVLYPSETNNDNCLNQDHWYEKNPLNFPGPFYTGQTDTCCTGMAEALDNVMIDEDCCEYISRQPKNYAELVHVMSAAAVEIFDGYSCNGNKYWTYDACRKWWSTKPDIIRRLNSKEIEENNFGTTKRYIDYLNTDAKLDLRRYCYFLLHNYYPEEDNLDLPIL